MRAWRAANPAKWKRIAKRSYSKNRNHILRQKAEYYTRKKLTIRERMRLARYGVTPAQFRKMLKVQCGKCFLCKKSPQRTNRPLGVDHCHATGKVRRLLCNFCNAMLGSAKDDPSLLRRGAKYVESFQKAK